MKSQEPRRERHFPHLLGGSVALPPRRGTLRIAQGNTGAEHRRAESRGDQRQNLMTLPGSLDQAVSEPGTLDISVIEDTWLNSV